MSVSIIAIPYALAWIVGATGIAVASELSNAHFGKEESSLLGEYSKNEVKNLDNVYQGACDDYHVINEQTLINKSFETSFMDKDVLIKTLDEHGISNIEENNGIIKGKFEKYNLIFEKPSEEKPYNLVISCVKEFNAQEMVEDLNNEYTLNVQEESYLSIIEKLKENNMEIEEEEVLEDNTIVLTVNVEQG